MKKSAYIICLIACLYAISCTETPDCREFQVPEIVSITSLPDIHTAILISDLKDIPDGELETGFYLGTDKSSLKRTEAVLEGRRFSMEVIDLQENTTYWFKAYVTNGINEIASGFESFITGSEPVIPDEPENPDDPETPDGPEQPDNPDDPETPDIPDSPDDPDNPDEPQEPEDPETPDNPDEPDVPDNPDEPDEPDGPDNPEEPVEFTTEITGTSATYSNDILELTANLGGDISLVRECWFMVGSDPEKMSRIQGSIEDEAVKAYLMGLDPGIYHYKAVISNGTETKESDTCQITISPN